MSLLKYLPAEYPDDQSGSIPPHRGEPEPLLSSYTEKNKLQITNTKQIPMTKIQNSKHLICKHLSQMA